MDGKPSFGSRRVSDVVDFKKLMNRTPEEEAQAERDIEKSRQEFIKATENDPDVIRMKKRLGE